VLETLLYLLVGLLTVSIPVLYWMRERKRSAKAESTLKKAIELGLDEPVSLHPVIDPNICIGSGACVRACPEQDVLGLINNRGALINPSRCIGHGMCHAACPVQAITLVFGTEKRGVDIPHLKGTFETNVEGLYIAGELGGMGLIRNAMTQGIQAAQYIAKSLATQREAGKLLDLVIVGAGPAGLGAALAARSENLEFVIIDQEDLGGTVLTYPRRKLVMTRPVDLPIYGKLKLREVQKEALLELFLNIFSSADLKVHAGQKVDEVKRENGRFTLTTAKGETFEAKRVLLAIGRRGSPRKLGVPGEKSAKVAYRLLDPEKYHDMNILVVGGGDSAVEAAVALSEVKGNTVHLSYRRDRIFRIKEGNKERLDKAAESGKIQLLLPSEVKEILEDAVILDREGETITLPNDQVFIFAGGELPTAFLERAGVTFTKKFGEA